METQAAMERIAMATAKNVETLDTEERIRPGPFEIICIVLSFAISQCCRQEHSFGDTTDMLTVKDAYPYCKRDMPTPHSRVSTLVNPKPFIAVRRMHLTTARHTNTNGHTLMRCFGPSFP
jgi:hypothetical protein